MSFSKSVALKSLHTKEQHQLYIKWIESNG